MPIYDAICSILANWNVSVEQLPEYFLARFGGELLNALNAVQLHATSDLEQRKIAIFRYWVNGYLHGSDRERCQST
jgi:hypothetical protein